MSEKSLKTIGILGGMSWESTTDYYRILNETVRRELGGLHSAKILMYSFDFAEIEKMQADERWRDMATLLSDEARRLEKAGADIMLIATNTMHKVAPSVQDSISVPLLHIADATAQESKSKGLKILGLLGTRFTMEEDFYKKRLKDKHGLEVVVPDQTERQLVHDVIYDELCQGVISDSSRTEVKKIIDELITRGAEGVILGCTELPLLFKGKSSEVPLLDTTTIHATAAVKMAVE